MPFEEWEAAKQIISCNKLVVNVPPEDLLKNDQSVLNVLKDLVLKKPHHFGEALCKAAKAAFFQSHFATECLLYDELSEVKVAVFVTFDIDLVPCDLCKMNAEEALCVESLVAVYEINLAGELCSNSAEFNHVSVCDKLDLIKVFAASFHN